MKSFNKVKHLFCERDAAIIKNYLEYQYSDRKSQKESRRIIIKEITKWVECIDTPLASLAESKEVLQNLIDIL